MEKAILAKQRIKEIEEGQKREFIETIQDPAEIQRLVLRVISSAIEEIDILSSTPNSFKRYEKEGIVDILTNRVNGGSLKVRILVNRNDLIQETLDRLTQKHPQLQLEI
jgi:hypothetical protein